MSVSVPCNLSARYDWYQTDAHVTIVLMRRDVLSVECKVKFDGPKITIQIGEEVVFSEQLYDNVDSSQVTVNCTKKRVEITLPKISPVHWQSLTVVRSADAMCRSQKSNKPNWDQIGRDIDNEEQEGNDGIEKFFQTIYKDASDEVKKAMIKSFTESQGTVLSTNWGEVGKEKVSINPPDGMEYKKYDN